MIVLVDTREQTPLPIPAVTGCPVERASLPTGDYALRPRFGESVVPIGKQAVVERKSLQDAIASVRRGRDRFAREWERMAAIIAAGGFAAVLIESSPEAFDAAAATAPGAAGTYRSWSRRYGIPVVFCPTREAAAAWVVDFLRAASAALVPA